MITKWTIVLLQTRVQIPSQRLKMPMLVSAKTQRSYQMEQFFLCLAWAPKIITQTFNQIFKARKHSQIYSTSTSNSSFWKRRMKWARTKRLALQPILLVTSGSNPTMISFSSISSTRMLARISSKSTRMIISLKCIQGRCLMLTNSVSRIKRSTICTELAKSREWRLSILTSTLSQIRTTSMTSTSTMRTCGSSFSRDTVGKQCRGTTSESPTSCTPWWSQDLSKSLWSCSTARTWSEATSTGICLSSGGPRSVKTPLSRSSRRESSITWTVPAKILPSMILDSGCTLSQRWRTVKHSSQDASMLPEEVAIPMKKTPRWMSQETELRSKSTVALSSQDKV